MVLPLDKIQSVAQNTEPENVVRLALRICRHVGHTNLTQISEDCVQCFAVNLLASALIPNVPCLGAYRAAISDSSRTTRAANCVLVHLGAIKAEKGSDDDLEVRQLNQSTWEQRRLIYLSTLRQLVQQYGNRLNDTAGPAWNSIRFLLSQKAEQRQTDDSQVTKIPTEADRLQDDLVTLLESQLARVQIS